MSTRTPLTIAKALPDALMLVSRDGQIRDANISACRLLGRTRNALLSGTLFDVIESPREKVEQYLRTCVRTDRLVPGAFEVQLSEGNDSTLRCHGCGVSTEQERCILIRWTAITAAGSGFLRLNQRIDSLESEIRRRVHSESSLRDSEARTRIILETAAESIVTFLEDGQIESFNRAAERTFGYPAREFVGQNIRRLLPAEFADADPTTILEHLGHKEAENSSDTRRRPNELLARHRDGDLIPVDSSLAEVAYQGDRLFVGIFRDNRERRQLEARLTHQATHDHLTGLPNRILLEDRLSQAIESAKRRGEMLAVYFIDLDRFKVVNDSLGHEFGDLLLCDFAERLQQKCRDSDTVARLGGDEFVWLATGLRSEDDALVPAQKILDQTVEPFLLSGQEFIVSASIGISVFPRDGLDAQTLLRRADAAMYVAKADGKNTFSAYSSEIGDKAARRLELENRLRKAIQNEELCLHYQPQVSVEDGSILGVEALVRWEDPEFGLVQPDDFIPLAEETGLIVSLGMWVLEEACRQAVRWREAGLSNLRMAVNVSPRQFEQFDLFEFVGKVLEQTGLDPKCLELELTEQCVMADVEVNRKRLEDLKSLGLRISIDDFGTGQSSLAYLQRFSIDVIKIDRCFVKDMDQNEGDLALVRTIIALARSLGLRTVAEGVETEEHLALLRAEGCDEFQGYLVSRPLPAAEIEHLLFRAAPDV
jgi:diguanylate cyclase (GGDEF)-like protein/PAS domain S-box-containing protein